MSVRVLSARTRSERRSSAFPGSVINSCLMNLTHPRLIILGNSSTKGQKTIKSWRRAGRLPSRHGCEAIELMTLCFTPSLISETQPGKGLEYRSVNVPTESSFSLLQKAYWAKGSQNKLVEKGYECLLQRAKIKVNPV